jgi:hypothetical protein
VDEGAAADADYFQGVERFFVELRGDPLMLSNADWFLVWKWRRAGLPLRVVLRGIADAMESHALSWSRDRKVSSLAYCRAEVERAARRWREDLAPETEARRAAADELLARWAAALEASDLSGVAAERARELASALRIRAGRARRGPALDRWLAEREQELVEALLRSRTPLARESIESEVAAGVAGFRGRLPERVLAQVEAESRARLVLGACGLPRLSLFEADDV